MENQNDHLNEVNDQPAKVPKPSTKKRLQSDDVSEKYNEDSAENGLSPKTNNDEDKKMNHDAEPAEENASVTPGAPLEGDVQNNETTEAEKE